MTRMYLSPAATTFAKIGLLIIQLMIGLFNVITFPIRKITLKAYALLLAAVGLCYPVIFQVEMNVYIPAFAISVGILAVGLIAIRVIYKVLNKKVSPKVAYMFNSPLGIRLNRFYN